MRRTLAIGLAIFAIAIALRIPALDRLPPAIHQDEASNAVDGWSLLEDGVDRSGRSWPVFLEGFGAGDNRTSLFAILTIPGIAIFGPGTFAARLPAALIGVWTVVAVYLFTRKVRGEAAALWAAGLLAVNPWHVYLSRFGHEASITPTFLITALWLVAGVGRPRAGDGYNKAYETPRAFRFGSAARWGGAGLILAAGLYSYPSCRLFLPVIVVIAWIFRLGPRSGRGSLALPAAMIVGAVPLIFASLAHPERLIARASAASVLGNVEPIGIAVWVIVRQFAGHFLPGFLFIRGDGNPLQSPPGGELLWAELPGLLIGLVIAARRRDRWDRLSLAWLLLYPLSSAMTLGDRPEYIPHSLRAAVGLPLFQILGGDGIATSLRWIGRRLPTRGPDEGIAPTTERRERSSPEPTRPWASGRSAAIGGLWGIAIAGNLLVVAYQFAGNYSRDVAPRYHAAYPPAIRFLAANPDRYDALIISGQTAQQAYIYSILYGLQTPRSYRESTKEISHPGQFHLVRRVNRIHYYYDRSDLEAIVSSVRGRVWIVCLPGEIRGGTRIQSFPYPGGDPGLEIRGVDL